MHAVPIEKLASIKKFICHGNCPDGLASAIILDDAFPGVEIVFAQHNKTILTPEPNVLFCDYCPVDNVDEWREQEAVILDHHKGVEGIVRSFKYHAFGDEVNDPGVSGAVLAYRHAWLVNDEQDPSDRALWRNTVERFARLAGIRDTWQTAHEDWHAGGEQAEMLMFYPVEDWLGPVVAGSRLNLILRDAGVLAGRREAGRVSYAKRLKSAREMAENATHYVSAAKGTRVAIMPVQYVSDAADVLADRCDIAIGFHYGMDKGQPSLLLSTRSRGQYNCAEFCKYFKGGGHTNAAGAKIPFDLSQGNPFVTIMRLIEQYEVEKLLPAKE